MSKATPLRWGIIGVGGALVLAIGLQIFHARRVAAEAASHNVSTPIVSIMTPGLGAFAITTLNPTSTTPIAVGVAGPIHRMREKRSLILSELKQFMLEFDSGSTPPLI